MKKRIIYILIPIFVFALVFLGRSLSFYSGFYSAPEITPIQPNRLEILSEPLSSPLPPPDVVVSTVLIDNSHANGYDEEELTILFGRITAAGGRVETITYNHDLSEHLRRAGSYIVIANISSFDAEDLLAVDEFVRKGGRLLIIGEPLRIRDVNSINSLAGQFGIIYQDDYIYNLVENDGSYLNVILDDFEENPLTENLDRIVFQGAHSLRVGEGALIMGDENTFSSLREKPGDVVTAALTTDDRVLALPDMTFLTGPFNTFADNDIFIDNIVHFLLSSERTFTLLDFPAFFSQYADIVYTDSELLDKTLDEAFDLRELLSSIGLVVSLSSEHSTERPLIYLSTYDDMDWEVRSVLENDGITFNGNGSSSSSNGDQSFTEVELKDIGSLELRGTALFHLHQDKDGAYQLYILADSASWLKGAIEMLLKDGPVECLVSPNTAFCEPDIDATETPTPTPTPTPKPKETNTFRTPEETPAG
jgi:hypothetical protein